MEKILIVDDSELNREILTEMLSDEYEIFEAANGKEAITVLAERNTEISLVLLDMVMPVMDGMEVLDIMNKNGWLADLPVIMISSEDSAEVTHKAYDLGVTEFIRRPFDALIVKKRCNNVTRLYAKQKKLAGIIADQYYEKEKNSKVMIEILANTVEFRNGECGDHVVNVQSYTEILLRELVKLTDKYELSESDISLISTVSALHDIGKICIPDEIINKPGRLTDEEFKIMKSHSAVGSQMISNVPLYRDEPIVKLAYAISRWHHERWDGRGYPDGLKGDDIPIGAQAVSLADVYDALTAERCYKKAFSHETAIEMISKGECGQFNPLLITCMMNCAEEMRLVKEGNRSGVRGETEIKEFAHELLRNDAMYSSDRLLHLLEYEKMKSRFFEGITGGYSFEYNAASDMLSLSTNAAIAIGVDETIIDPVHNEKLCEEMGSKTLADLSAKFRALSAEQPIVQFYVHQLVTVKPGEETPVRSLRITDTAEENTRYPADTKCYTYKLVCRTTWTLEEPQRYTGVIGKLVPAGNVYGFMKGAESNDFRSLL
ncbi:MAG: response regulator [Lachnospiraceae bacterium]|nr:response regulator [Ruminococcus sp.]MCM1273749.1 response regulator [Lachnospiraceae bacterium]